MSRILWCLLFAVVFLSSCSSRPEPSPDEMEKDTPWFNSSGFKSVFGDFDETQPRYLVSSKRELQKLQERGRYLTHEVAACGACHGAVAGDPGSPLSGGRKMMDGYGAVYAPNITSDTETGIGAWTITDLVRATRNSINKEGKPLSVRLHSGYRWMSDIDAKSIAVYLLSTEPKRVKVERRDLGGFERNQWYLFPRHSEMKGYIPEMPPVESFQYGKYLADNVAGCKACHTAQSATADPYTGSRRGRSRTVVSVLKGIAKGMLSPGEEKEIDLTAQDEEQTQGFEAYLSPEARKEMAAGAKAEAEEKSDLPAAYSQTPYSVKPKFTEGLLEGRFPVGGPDIRGLEEEGGLAGWEIEDIVYYLSSGKPSGDDTALTDSRLCPWPFYKGMSDRDKRSIALYLKQL